MSYPGFKICPTCKIEGKLLIEGSDGISDKTYEPDLNESDPDIKLSENRVTEFYTQWIRTHTIKITYPVPARESQSWQKEN